MNEPVKKATSPPARSAFTLIELLAVILIIMILLGTLLPTLAHIRVQVLVNTSQATINTLHGACMQYYAECDEYPPGSNLAEELTGYRDDDGKAGFGWRKRKRGKVYGPYHGTEELATSKDVSSMYFYDAFNNLILYYRYGPIDDEDPDSEKGYKDGSDGPADLDAYARNDKDEFYRRDFILLSRGPDGEWEKYWDDGHWTRSDDITNFAPGK